MSAILSSDRDAPLVLPRDFESLFGRAPFVVAHALRAHPLFEPGALRALANRMPESLVEKNADGTWMVLKNVESDPAFRALLDACLDEVPPAREPLEAREAFAFVSEPHAFTPYHMDPEHNFLLQIRGTKRIEIFDGEDRSILSEEELERFWTGGGRNLVWDDRLAAKAKSFTLRPGEGLYFPVTHPHRVFNGPETSVSFSVTFRTRAATEREIVHKINRHLRAAGITPGPAGERPSIDRAKLAAWRLARRLKRLKA
jgi:mannose-6-phosphate isomerase-like protein (cupin superfamily)